MTANCLGGWCSSRARSFQKPRSVYDCLKLNFVQKSWKHFSYTKSYNNELLKSYALQCYENSKPTFNQGHGQEMDSFKRLKNMQQFMDVFGKFT